MQSNHSWLLVVGLFLVTPACGGDSDDDGGDDGASGGNSGGSSGAGKGGSSSGSSGSSTGGSSTGGSSTGGSSTGGSSTGGSSTGGSSTGGSSTGGSGGTGTECGAGTVSLLSVPECDEFYTCIIEVSCESAGAQQQQCVDQTFAALQGAVCYPDSLSGQLSTLCASFRQTYAMQPMYAECAN